VHGSASEGKFERSLYGLSVFMSS